MVRTEPNPFVAPDFTSLSTGNDSVGLATNPAIAPQDNINCGCIGALSKVSIQNTSENSAKATAAPILG